MPHLTAIIFAVLSLIFAGLVVRDYLHSGMKLSLSARIRLRVAIIFAVVAVLLMVLI